MSTSLVLTIIGPDRPGLVDALAAVIARQGGNWLESRMASLAGQFAGILLASVPESQAEALTAALRELESQGLKIVVAKSTLTEPPRAYRPLTLTLVGQDHPGIIRDVAHVLASLGINIEELSSECSSASWSGETLFHATARLGIPQAVAVDQLRAALEGLANEIMVDITLDETLASPA